MPVEVLKAVGELCRRMVEEVKDVQPSDLRDAVFTGYVPLLAGGVIGACRGTLGLQGLESGKVERVIALYDEGDDPAPVLILVEEEIQEFISKTQE